MPIPIPPLPSREDAPSPEEVMVTEAFRRRALAITERCLPAIIREAQYEELEELIAAIQSFGSREAFPMILGEQVFDPHTDLLAAKRRTFTCREAAK